MKRILLFYLVLLLISACKTESEFIEPEVTLVLTVKDSKGNLLKGAKVGLFDSEQAYNNGKDGDFQGAVDTALTNASGEVTFSGLEDIMYYFHVTYSDQQTGEESSNLNSDYKLKQPLEERTTTFAEITLTKAGSFVAFYTGTLNSDRLPFKIKLGQDTFTLNSTKVDVPARDNEAGAEVRNKNPGVYTYSAVGNSGCVQFGTIRVEEDGYHPVLIEECETGRVAFFTRSPVVKEITISLNENDLVGVISPGDEKASVPTCSDNTLVYGDRAPGYYNYAATIEGDTIWSGQAIISEDGCSLIELD